MAWSSSADILWNCDRLINRFADYPSWLRSQIPRFDLFHVVDHSYSQLVHILPPERTIITCHDLDTFRCLITPDKVRRPRWFRAMTKRILNGFRRAAHIICVSHSTQSELLRQGWFEQDQITVIHPGVHPAFISAAVADRKDIVHGFTGSDKRTPFYVMHAGSTAPRKRIDIVLRAFASAAHKFTELRLVKAGEPLTSSQSTLAQSLGIADRLIAAQQVNRDTLAALYRNCAVLLQPSDAEGFGLPVIEALACGCPVLASDIPALREAGGEAATYCQPGEVGAWADALSRLLQERAGSPQSWEMRRRTALEHAARFSWRTTARQTAAVYSQVIEKA